MTRKVVKEESVRRKKKVTGKAADSSGIVEKLQESEAWNQSLLNALPDLLFILNKEGVVLDTHAPDPSSLIVSPSNLVGRYFKEILPRDVGEKLDPLLDQVLESGRLQSFEYTLTVSGKGRHFEARIVRYEQEKILSIIRDITERKELEKALKETQERYKQLVDHAPTGIWEIDYRKQKVVSVNDILCDYLGYTREEILSGNPMDFLTEESQRLFGERLRKIMADEPVPSIFELEVQTKKGPPIWTLMNIKPIYEGEKIRGAVVIAQDITTLKSVEKALRESEGHLRSLLENAKDFVVYRLVYDGQSPYGLRVVFVSPSLKELTGVSDPMNFETWYKKIHPDDLERINKARVMSFKTLNFDEAMRIFHPRKKEWRWIQVTANGILDQKGLTMHINGILTDITEKKRAQEVLQQAHDHLEQRVRERTVQLSETNKRLKKEIVERKQAEKALSRSEKKLRFFSDRLINAQENERKRIARELHDELGQSMIGLKFQLSKVPKKLKKDQYEMKGEIERALKALDEMTENIRRLSRDLRPSVLEYLGLWEALQWLFDEGAKTYGLIISNYLREPPISFSKEQELIIFRIFQEALTNIGKHARAKQVSVEVTEEGGKAVFCIEDNGKGFDLKEVAGSTSPDRGLGLTAMDERARMAGGILSIWSQKRKGTKITFTVPIKQGRKKTG